ncbi:hypothetical protein H4219_000033 [Mycoemilia scoparia]|uniref:Protein kinase domain-containing protein n=1 Tax=Mycoemilia scoparia TaxID=417184 RepID=A0A9W8A6L5_9FUNG|nr:hypothetical protein H4219_000033 [Mycoemilia scoparia]
MAALVGTPFASKQPVAQREPGYSTRLPWRRNHHHSGDFKAGLTSVANNASHAQTKTDNNKSISNNRKRPNIRINTHVGGSKVNAAYPPVHPSSKQIKHPYVSSTFEDNDVTLLRSGLSCLLNGGPPGRYNPERQVSRNFDGNSIYRTPHPRTPMIFTPGPSVTTPGHVKLDQLPYSLGEIVVDPNTGNTYELIGVLGQGSYAFVYQARCEDDGSIYALKCLSKANLTQNQKEMLRIEVDLHQAVSPHPHIVRLYSSFENHDFMFLVMERIAGHDLYEYLTKHPRYNNTDYEKHRFEKGIRFFEQMVEAVKHIHASKVYHRDLKPENFIVTPNGTLKLTDFGLSTKERSSEVFECGSRPYMSFENRNGGLPDIGSSQYGHPESYSPRLSDVWALGILFINLMFVESPWKDPSVETDFQFEGFIREGSSYLHKRFPKCPREICDFLCTRVFCPESQRCSVIDLKQWARTIGNFFSLSYKDSASTLVPKIGHNFGHSYKKSDWGHQHTEAMVNVGNISPPSKVLSSHIKKSKNIGGTFAVTPEYSTIGSHADKDKCKEAPNAYGKDGCAIPIPGKLLEDVEIAKKKSALSTSVPAFLFSKIMPASKVAAAQKAMPRDFKAPQRHFSPEIQSRVTSISGDNGNGVYIRDSGMNSFEDVNSSEWSLVNAETSGSRVSSDNYDIFEMDDEEEMDFSVPICFDQAPVPIRRQSDETLSEERPTSKYHAVPKQTNGEKGHSSGYSNPPSLTNTLTSSHMDHEDALSHWPPKLSSNFMHANAVDEVIQAESSNRRAQEGVNEVIDRLSSLDVVGHGKFHNPNNASRGMVEPLPTTKSCSSAKTLTSGSGPLSSTFFAPSNFDWADDVDYGVPQQTDDEDIFHLEFGEEDQVAQTATASHPPIEKWEYLQSNGGDIKSHSNKGLLGHSGLKHRSLV